MAINFTLLDSALNFIEEHPQHWDQTRWHCGTTHCLAGIIHCFLLEVDPTTAEINQDDYWNEANGENAVRNRAQEALQINDAEADKLFYYKNTFEELKSIRNAMFEGIEI